METEVQEGEGGIGDGPDELEVGVKGVTKVNELSKLLVGSRGSIDTAIDVAEEEMDSASVSAEKGLFHCTYVLFIKWQPELHTVVQAWSIRFVSVLGDIISGASDELVFFYSTWNLYCL
eukprot:g28189.t1